MILLFIGSNIVRAPNTNDGLSESSKWLEIILILIKLINLSLIHGMTK